MGMPKKKTSLSLAERTGVDSGKGNNFSDVSRQDPAEGHRLIRAFLAIKDARLRKAFVALVEELSNCQSQ